MTKYDRAAMSTCKLNIFRIICCMLCDMFFYFSNYLQRAGYSEIILITFILHIQSKCPLCQPVLQFSIFLWWLQVTELLTKIKHNKFFVYSKHSHLWCWQSGPCKFPNSNTHVAALLPENIDRLKIIPSTHPSILMRWLDD